MNEPLCTCCDLPLSSCGKAAEDRQRAADRQRETALVGRGFIAAKFSGVCAGCGDHYGVGAMIRFAGPPTSGWVTECCA